MFLLKGLRVKRKLAQSYAGKRDTTTWYATTFTAINIPNDISFLVILTCMQSEKRLKLSFRLNLQEDSPENELKHESLFFQWMLVMAKLLDSNIIKRSLVYWDYQLSIYCVNITSHFLIKTTLLSLNDVTMSVFLLTDWGKPKFGISYSFKDFKQRFYLSDLIW